MLMSVKYHFVMRGTYPQKPDEIKLFVFNTISFFEKFIVK